MRFQFMYLGKISPTTQVSELLISWLLFSLVYCVEIAFLYPTLNLKFIPTFQSFSEVQVNHVSTVEVMAIFAGARGEGKV